MSGDSLGSTGRTEEGRHAGAPLVKVAALAGALCVQDYSLPPPLTCGAPGGDADGVLTASPDLRSALVATPTACKATTSQKESL